jgi:hypothetical protein
MVATTTWPTLQSGLPANQLIDYPGSTIMHHKYLIVDPSNTVSDPMVLTGSHNWTSSADSRNDENTVIIHDAVIANIYYQEFAPLFIQSGGVIGVEVLENGVNMNVYPNPAQDNCVIDFTLGNAENISLVVTDFSGKVISSASVTGVAGANKASVNTGALPAGVYFIRLNGQNFTSVSRIMVNH